jgi:hypothetical protein
METQASTCIDDPIPISARGEEGEGGEMTNLFGEETPRVDPKHCGHLNTVYTLHCVGMLKIRTEYGPGIDRVEEIERSNSWTGNIQGRCPECGKDLYYTGSNLPKFIKRRLRKAGVPEIVESPWISEDGRSATEKRLGL